MLTRETTMAIAVAVGFLSACGATSSAPAGSPTAPEESPATSIGPYDPDAQMSPELMRVTPSPAVAGQPIEVRFPEETERGVGWVLEEQEDNLWHARWSLTAASGSYGRDSENVPNWYPADDEAAFTWDALAIAGPGPDTLLIPDDAQPGTYRLCSANKIDNMCVKLEITD